MTTRRRRREPRLDRSNNLLARARRRQRVDERFALNPAEIPQLIDKCLKIGSLHDIPAGDKPSVSKVSQHQSRTEPSFELAASARQQTGLDEFHTNKPMAPRISGNH